MAWPTGGKPNIRASAPTTPLIQLLDFDGDGISNRNEYLSGTDPTNLRSVMKLTFATTNSALLEFVAQSNIAYSLQFRTNLVFWFVEQPDESQFPVADTHGAGERGFITRAPGALLSRRYAAGAIAQRWLSSSGVRQKAFTDRPIELWLKSVADRRTWVLSMTKE